MNDTQFLTLVNIGFAIFVGFPWGLLNLSLAVMYLFFWAFRENS